MKHIITGFIIFSISALSFYSCSSLRKISIQVGIAPRNQISPDIQSIAILNRSLTLKFMNINADSVEIIMPENPMSIRRTTFLDSSAVDTTINVAAKAIFGSQRFDVVVPLQHNIAREDSGGILAPMDSSSIDEICKTFNVDAVLLLEHFTEKVGRHNYYDSEYSYGESISLEYFLEWRLYQPRLRPIVLNFPSNDVIFWKCQQMNYFIGKLPDKLPTIKEALIGGGLASGLDIADLICPKWVDETRFYYITGNKELDSAIPFIKMNKWEEAADIWMKYSSESDKSLCSKVEYNLALASEMKGNTELAVEWGNKSLQTKYSRNAADYLMNLSRRSLNHNRYYYTTENPEIDTAISMIKQHKWDEAAKIWMKYSSVNDKILQSMIEYNLALTAEMKGNIDLAIKWGAKSLETNNSLNTKQYLSELQKQSRLNKVVKNSIRRTRSNQWEEPSMIPWALEGRDY